MFLLLFIKTWVQFPNSPLIIERCNLFTIEKYAVYRKVYNYSGGELATDFRLVAEGLTLSALKEVLSLQRCIDEEDLIVGREVKQYEDVTEEFSWMLG